MKANFSQNNREITLLLDRYKTQLTKRHPKINLLYNQPLSSHTSLKLGGPADILVKPSTSKQFIDSWLLAHQINLPVVILGGGTNVLISDQGIRGIVIVNQTASIDFNSAPSHLQLKADSGIPLTYLVQQTLKKNYIDLIDFINIPGSLGGAVWNNAHFNNKFIGSFIKTVQAVSPSGQIRSFTRQQIKFGYDSSIFQTNHFLILSADLVLTQTTTPAVISDLVQQSILYRRKTQPHGVFSSGCVFQNLSALQQQKLKLPTPSAGYLIDQAGLKGVSVGGASVSRRHANFFVHTGQATASDFNKLIKLVKKTIKDKYDVNLKEEIKLLGFTKNQTL
ncbi:MAG: UDP-N-acetylmuramate dehydrogenase [bacterium]|nr:UDP-N-acetylmuramate dehydrogenase [bacterium]